MVSNLWRDAFTSWGAEGTPVDPPDSTEMARGGGGRGISGSTHLRVVMSALDESTWRIMVLPPNAEVSIVSGTPPLMLN